MADQLVVAPSNPDFLVLRSTFGILLSKDRGVSWDWTCEKSIGYGGSEDPSMGVTGSSAVIAGTFEGVSVSHDLGCDWKAIPGGLDKQVVIDVVVRPDAPASVLALSNKYASADDGGALFDSKVFSSTDDGKTFSTLGIALDSRLIMETIEVSKSEPDRVYISAVRNSGTPNVKGVLLVSTDRGMTYKELPIPLATNELAPFIAAVDPKNAQRVYVRTAGKKPSPNRLLVTDDAGATYRAVFASQGEMLGFAMLADGSKVYVGGPNDGLHVASSKDLVFTKKSSVMVQCLAVSASTVYACSNEASGFILGSSTNDGETFTPMLHLATLRGPLECPAKASQALCLPDWPSLRDQLGGSAGSDGGLPPDAAALLPDAGTPVASAPGGKGGGCAEGQPKAGTLGGYAPAVGIVAALAFALHRRRRARLR